MIMMNHGLYKHSISLNTDTSYRGKSCCLSGGKPSSSNLCRAANIRRKSRPNTSVPYLYMLAQTSAVYLGMVNHKHNITTSVSQKTVLYKILSACDFVPSGFSKFRKLSWFMLCRRTTWKQILYVCVYVCLCVYVYVCFWHFVRINRKSKYFGSKEGKNLSD